MTSCLPAEGAFTAAFSVDNPGKMLTSGTGKDECNPHVWIWCQIHNSSGKVSSSSEIYSHSISAENSLGRAGERSVMQVKETKGRKTFWPWAEDLQWACSSAHLEGMCTCRSHDHAGLGHAWSLLKEHSWGCLAEHQLCCPCVSLALHPPLAVAALALLAQCSRASATASRFWWLRAEHLWQSLMLGACTEMEVSEWSLPAWSDAVANRVCFGTCFVMEGCRRLLLLISFTAYEVGNACSGWSWGIKHRLYSQIFA